MRLFTLLGVVIMLFSFFAVIPTGYTGILATFGKVEDTTMDAGLNFKLPWQDVITMDNRAQKVSYMDSAFSSDIQQVDVTYSINYNIDKTTAMNLYRNVGTGYLDTIILPRMTENLKAVFSKYTADRLVSERESLSAAIESLMRLDMKEYGITIIAINIENVDFTNAYTNAVESKQVAAQRKLQAETEQAQITMEAQAKAKRDVIEAEAKAQKDEINAKVEANIKKVQADADEYAALKASDAEKYTKENEAEANEKLSKSITNALIQYVQVQQWDGQMPDVMTGTSMSILDIAKFSGQE